ncbi:COPII-coated vesicle protein [Endogone sp. FLAS-F59071]|nr:COPII-coated vesicle protein [Endogone sp. FLAS-F59071]|eukprot:RUS15407.1 COPII-coated vesicle protein [Endogone sp. FLAS-F59071]
MSTRAAACLFLVLLLACLLHTAHPASINIPAHGKECFFEELNKGDRMTVTFQVGEGGNLDVDFWLSDPADHIIKSGARESTGTHTVVAELKGRYTYCFSNQMSAVTDKSVSFNVHGMKRVEEDAAEAIDPLERELRELADSMSSIKDEQEYIVIRERQHRDTAESTNSRVVWWSLLQTALLIAVCLWQVFYLKRFFENKRVV